MKLPKDDVAVILQAVIDKDRGDGWSDSIGVEMRLRKGVWKTKSTSFPAMVFGQFHAQKYLGRISEGESTFYRVTASAIEQFALNAPESHNNDKRKTGGVAPPDNPATPAPVDAVNVREDTRAVMEEMSYHDRTCLGWRNTPGKTPAEKMAQDLKKDDVQRVCSLKSPAYTNWFVMHVLIPNGILKRVAPGIFRWAVNPEDQKPTGADDSRGSRWRPHFSLRQLAQRLWDNQPGETVDEKPAISSTEPPLGAMGYTSVAYAQQILFKLRKLGYLRRESTRGTKRGRRILWVRNPHEWEPPLATQAGVGSSPPVIATAAIAAMSAATAPVQTPLTLDQFYEELIVLLSRVPVSKRRAVRCMLRDD